MYFIEPMFTISFDSKAEKVIQLANEEISEIGSKLNYEDKLVRDCWILDKEDKKLLSTLRDNINFILNDLQLGD